MVVQHKERLVLYALSATIGSLAGCLALYYIGRKGGEFASSDLEVRIARHVKNFLDGRR